MAQTADERQSEELYPFEDGNRQYRAFRIKRAGLARSLYFDMADGTHHRFKSYMHLFDGDPARDGTQIILRFPDEEVHIDGRNLLLGAKGIAEGIVTVAEQFDPTRRDEPREGDAVITSIRFVLLRNDDNEREHSPRHEPETERRAVSAA